MANNKKAIHVHVDTPDHAGLSHLFTHYQMNQSALVSGICRQITKQLATGADPDEWTINIGEAAVAGRNIEQERREWRKKATQ